MNRTRIREILLAHGFKIPEGSDDLREYVYTATEALLAEVGAPPGWRLVPEHPTPEMLIAINWPNDPVGYRCMLSVAPTPPAAHNDAGYAAGIQAVATMLERKADAFAEEFGYDDMGGLSFGRGREAAAKGDYHQSLLELADEVRAMLDAAPTLQMQQCRADGRCQYAIDSAAEGLGHCPPGKCVMPVQQDDEALGALRLALDALTCGDTGYDLEDSHRCGRCDENVDRNASVRQRIRALIEKRGAA